MTLQKVASATSCIPKNVADHRRRRLHRLEFAGDPPKADQRVVGLDNFATGYRRNLDEVQALVAPSQWARFDFIEGDICSLSMPTSMRGRRLCAA